MNEDDELMKALYEISLETKWKGQGGGFNNGIYVHWRTFWLRSYQALEFQLYLILSLESGILGQSMENWNKC